MLHRYSYSPNYSDDILSIFDIGGVLLQKRYHLPTQGLIYDVQQLTEDRNILETDTWNASKKISEEMNGVGE